MNGAHNYSIVRTKSIQECFDYYRDIEGFTARYPKHCAKIVVEERSENSLKTSELWNISLFDKLSIKVDYLFIPTTEIRYEITEGIGHGMKGVIRLTAQENGTLVYGSLPILDIIVSHLSSQTETFDNNLRYIIMQDSIHLDGKNIEGFKAGDICSVCKKGKLYFKNSELTQPTQSSEIQSATNFECDLCHEIFSNAEIKLKERVRVSDSVDVE